MQRVKESDSQVWDWYTRQRTYRRPVRVACSRMHHDGRTSQMRTKTLWLWLALLVSSFALIAGGCGGDDDEAADTGATVEEGAKAADQVITVNWGTEPPSLDPG